MECINEEGEIILQQNEFITINIASSPIIILNKGVEFCEVSRRNLSKSDHQQELEMNEHAATNLMGSVILRAT